VNATKDSLVLTVNCWHVLVNRHVLVMELATALPGVALVALVLVVLIA
jgi:hypothetical protein